MNSIRNFRFELPLLRWHYLRKICVCRRIYQVILLSFCGALLLGPLSVLQLGAWSWMLFAYSHEAGFSTAMEETFSGERPCRLCTMIEESAAESNTHSDPASVMDREFKLLALKLQNAAVIGLPSYQMRYPLHDAVPSRQLQDVNLPPPK